MLGRVSHVARLTARLPPPVPSPPQRLTRVAARLHPPLLTCCFVAVCYCGRGSLSLVDEVNIGKCNQPCTEWGDHGKHEACGGGDETEGSTAYVSVYNISVPATIPQPPTEIDISGKTSYLLGCYLLASNIEDSQDGPLDEIEYGEDLWMKNEVGIG